jgi:serine-type D-Ala-D-Ala carboxypeptidase (penicillin-binding protein 5/6)
LPGLIRAAGPARLRRSRASAAGGAAALLIVMPLAAPPALAGTALGGTAVGGTAVGGTAVGGTVVGGTVVGGTVVGGTVVGGTVVGGPELAGRGVIVHYPAHSARRLPSVRASAYMVADAGSGRVLAAKDPHGHFLPASTLKVLTADALMPVLKPDAEVVTSAMAADVEPNKVGLVKGHAYPVSDLFQALLLISANDAAIALAQATGSYDKGVALMNAEARRLQADDTVARRPNGLNAKGQHTSAYDLALFARQALTLHQFMRIEATRTAMFPLHRRHSIELFNQNTMLNTYRGDLGGKIGWTTASETTFIAWARRDGHTLIVTIMHCVPLTEMTIAAKLLNWGFAMDGKVTPVGTLVRPRPAAEAAPPATSGPGAGVSKHGVSQRGVSRHGVSQHGAVAPAAGLHRTAGQRKGRLVQPAGFATIPVTAGIGALLLAALVAAGIVVLRHRAGGGNPPGP